MPAMPAPLELAPPELAPPELARSELIAVQMLLLYAPPEPEVCFHLLRDRRCSVIVTPVSLGLAPLELAPRSVLYQSVREIVLFIGTRFSNLYTSVHTPA
jgi:hypothetical protein